MNDQSRERELLRCCARTRLDASTRARIEALLRAGPDWQRLLELAQVHQVTPLVATTLCGSFASTCPVAVVEHLRTMARSLASRSLHLAQALVETLELLRAARIPAIPYKGPALSAMAYGDPGLRFYGDLDIWVHPWDYRFRIPEILVQTGWTQIADYGWEKSYRREGTSTVLDVHQSLTHRRNIPFSPRFDEALREATVVEVGGWSVRTLDPARMLVVLCVQLAKDAGEVDRSPLIKVCDIAELLASHPELDWTDVIRIARREGALRIVGLGLAVAETVLDARLPEEAKRLVGSVPHRDALVRHVEERMFGDEGGAGALQEFHDPVAWNAAIRERVRDRSRPAIALLHDVLVPNEPEYTLLRLPRRLYPLYAAIRPVRLGWKYFRVALGLRPGGTRRR